MRKYISLILIIAVVFTIAVPLMANTNIAVGTVTLEEQALVDINGGRDALTCAAIAVIGGLSGGTGIGIIFFVAAAYVAGCFG